jgi:hypothetical protein
MNPLRRLILSCALLAGAAAALAQPVSGASAAEIKRITDRYALTRTRISALLDQRLNPAALPANPPNPFYQPPREALNPEGPAAPDPSEIVPEAADISDIDTLRKYAATLRIGGVITRNGVPHLTINNTACKVGDIITVGNRDHPIYLKLLSLSPAEFTLGLNDATLVVPIRK